MATCPIRLVLTGSIFHQVNIRNKPPTETVLHDVHQSVISFIPFHGFSPLIKSLRVVFTVPLGSSQIPNLILSFPLLEDLAVITYFGASIYSGDCPDELSTVIQPSSPPTFTGSLLLSMGEGMEPIVHLLLSLPGGLNLRELALTLFYEEDLPSIMALIKECSHTLESLKISCSSHGTSDRHSRSHQ